MTVHTTPIHGLQAPNGDDPRSNGDDLLRALVDQLDLLLPSMGDLKPSFQTTDHGAWVLADGRNTLQRASYSAAFVSMMLAAGFTGSDGTHFGVPDWRGRDLRGADPTGTVIPNNPRSLGQAGGEERHKLIAAEGSINGNGSTQPGGNHNHGGADSDVNLQHYYNSNGNGGLWFQADAVSSIGAWLALGSSHDHGINYDGSHGHNFNPRDADNFHQNMPPYRTANIFIFAG